MSISYLKKHGVYFYFPEKRIDPLYRHYGVIALREGLDELGYAVYSNVQDARFKFKEIGGFKDGLMVFSVTEDVYSPDLVAGIDGFKPGMKVIHSMSDTSFSMMTPPSTLAFFSHENRFLQIQGRRAPWAFGLTRERIDSCAGRGEFASRKRELLRNFRPSLSQSVRESLDLALLPNLQKHFSINREINPDNHYSRLQSSVGCLAYGGAYRTDLTRNDHLRELPSNTALREWSSRVVFHQDPVILRWDSWRWWESLASGCLTLQLDLEKYGFLLPVMPERWKHYVPIDLSDPAGTVSQMMERESEWEAMASQGRQWAIDNYGPKPTAERFIRTVLR